MEQQQLNAQNPEDYLEKQQVGTYLKDAISFLLENRPENPIQFLADHFKSIHSSSSANQIPPQANGIVASGHNIMKAYRLLVLNKQGVLHFDQKSFSDNVFQAYQLLEKEHGSCGIKGFDLSKIAKMLCINYPHSVTQGILGLLDKREDENCDFEEFLSAVRTILMFDSFFEEMESIYRHIDSSKTNRVKTKDISDVFQKLRQPEVQSQHELRVPEPSDFEMACKRLASMGQIDSNSVVTLDEFLLVMFKTTQDDE